MMANKGAWTVTVSTFWMGAIGTIVGALIGSLLIATLGEWELLICYTGLFGLITTLLVLLGFIDTYMR